MYYLPIYVNNRRMHVVKMDRAAKDQVLFCFLANASDNYDVFSLPAEKIRLINDKGENVDLEDARFILESLEEKEGIPVYNVKIVDKGKKKSESEEPEVTGFSFYGSLGDTIEDGGDPFTLKANFGETRPEEYILQFSYEAVQNGKPYKYTGGIRICEYKDENELFKASLDFGSEASQVHLSTAKKEDNMNIRDAFVNIVGKDINEDYWQGRKGDEKSLYKSIYHIHKNPARTEFGDLPMNNEEDTFLQSLLPITASTEDMILLPNLKLIEQLNITAREQINFGQGGFMGEVQTDLSNNELNDGILRMILCNFLAVTMKAEAMKSYLHFILLVPNVYCQEKVHKLVSGLYEDFNSLKKHGEFERYKGLEVSIVSESDASFFGIRALVGREKLPWKKDAHYLVIDAGKGTTDFSLLAQKGESLSSYSSLYRSGIPASGHVLTYAFYDALRKYFHTMELGDFFDGIMSASVGRETAEILNFVSLLEQFKIRYTELKEDEEIDIKSLEENRNNTLYHLNTFLDKLQKEGKMVPGMKDALEEKIGVMVRLIKDSIVTYAKKQGIHCDNVFLTGRAFMLRPFKDAVSKMLVEEGLVFSEDDIFYQDDLTKSMCTYGAMKVGEQSVINKNSNMLGSPSLMEEFGDGAKIKESLLDKIIRWWRRLRGLDKSVNAEMSFDFFYEGLELSNARNATFSLSGIETLIGDGQSEDIQVYYLGDGYLCKHGKSSGRIESNGTISGLPDEDRKRLVKESMFPFNLASFGLDEISRKPKPADAGTSKKEEDAEPNTKWGDIIKEDPEDELNR